MQSITFVLISPVQKQIFHFIRISEPFFTTSDLTDFGLELWAMKVPPERNASTFIELQVAKLYWILQDHIQNQVRNNKDIHTFACTEERPKKRKEHATKASKRQRHSSPCVLQMLFRTHDSTQAFHLLTSHGLFTWWKHNHSGLSIETRVKNLPADLTAFLAKCTCMAKDMRHKVTSRLHMFPLHLILYAATAATTRPVHRLKASLFFTPKENKR